MVVVRFPPWKFGPAFSSPAFSTPVFFMVPSFPVPRFQSPQQWQMLLYSVWISGSWQTTWWKCVSTLRLVTLGQHLGHVPCYNKNLDVQFSSWLVAITYMNWWWSLHSQPFFDRPLDQT